MDMEVTQILHIKIAITDTIQTDMPPVLKYLDILAVELFLVCEGFQIKSYSSSWWSPRPIIDLSFLTELNVI